jgi:hypothetical protein
MNNIIVKMLDPEQYHLLEEFCKEEDIPMLDPEWSKVVAAIDIDIEKVVGIVAAQTQVHLEPIWIKKDYQGKGIWEEMADRLEGYIDGLALSSGKSIGVWNQPTNGAAERICRMRGYTKSEKPLYTKVYDGKKLSELLNKEEK